MGDSHHAGPAPNRAGRPGSGAAHVLILASTSRYRRELLARLGLPFESARPDTDETALPDEAPEALARRLAQAKAHAIASLHPQAWVIGSDQVAECDGLLLGKPGTRDAALTQLRAASGREVVFHTAVCVMRAADDICWLASDRTHVQFRDLHDDELARYVDAEQPFDCAGSFKSEGLGISLFERIRSDDPTALIGLPLIALCGLLRKTGFVLP